VDAKEPVLKKHTKIYLDYFGFQIPEDVACEICGGQANDIHHIEARGMGGDPNGDKDRIENLMAVCRKDHERYGDVPELEEKLKQIHLRYMEINA
jgi:beta-phosphoglucomutase-like phosphatase (HAD superfamily)